MVRFVHARRPRDPSLSPVGPVLRLTVFFHPRRQLLWIDSRDGTADRQFRSNLRPGRRRFRLLRYQGLSHGAVAYLKNDLVGPVWWLFFLMIPINLADNLFRPFSLGIRLYANMFADHTVLGIFTGLTKLVIPLAFYALGSIVCVIQAIIFVVLAMSYVRLATSHGH